MNHIGLALKSEDGYEPHDLYLEDDGNLAIVHDAEAVGQHVRQRLKTFEGEWFLDTAAGVPWLSEILGQRYDPALAEAVVKAEVLDTDAIKEITSFSVGFNRERRELTTYSISVLTDYDEDVAI
ncbi:MAG: hypothetical protein A49_05980 [Methyloceanibacter sp.]|nr:MAG: hypothetical protein A49_05980 [Methyloceanibacter sp.]